MGLKVTNNAFGTLNAGITNSDTTLVLQSGQGSRFPSLSSGDYFYATLIDTSNNLEIVKVTARSTDTMTIVRAQDNTTARAYSTNDRFELRPTAAMLNEVITKADTAQATADAALPKAGGTMTGQLVLDYNNTAAIIAKCASASAQIKLERTSTSTGAGYIGADDTNCLDVRDGSVVSRFFVDQSGRIKTPFQPCAIVKLDNDNSQGGQNSTIGPGGTNPSGSIIKFENIRRNTGSHYNASTGQFTCPVAGVYEVKFSSNINTSNGGFPAFPMIYRNGSLYLRAYDSISVSGWTQQAISAHIDCGAGDTLDIRLYVASGYMWADSDVDYTQVSFRFLG